MKRIQILWFGKPPTEEDKEQAKGHNFQLVAPVPSEDPDFHFGRAAIFWATGKYFGEATVSLKKYVSKALDEGLYVVVVVSGEAGDVRLKEVSKVLRDNDPHGALAGRYRVRSMPVSVHQLMNEALEYNPGPGKNLNLVIDPPELVTASEELLLKRAFHDCTNIQLKPIPRGYSGAKTFVVEARLAASNAGAEPEPFFAKLGNSGKLQDEMKRFREYAEYHVPWYLRPNFLPERSFYGVAEAILVGSFVKGSSTLAEYVRMGDGTQPIRSLFEETLAGLRRQSYTAEEEIITSVVDALVEFCNHDSVPTQRWAAAPKMFGGEPVEPFKLWCQMLSLPEQRWHKSGIHGDLHGENVRVRKQDAIIIDFAQACIGPASADLASLEVWLSFEPFNNGPPDEEWKAVVEVLYSPEAIDASLEDHSTIAGKSWIHACVAEIRRLARNAVKNKDEYKRVLAVYLLRQASFSTNPNHPEMDEFRRTYAYWLSCRLVTSLRAEANVTLEAT